MQFKQLLPLAATASLAIADVRPTTTVGQPTKPLTGDASAVTCGDGSVKHLEYFHTYGLEESHLDLTNNTRFTLIEPYTNFNWFCEGISAADGKEFGCHIQNATVPAPAAGFWYTDDLTVLNVIVRWDAGVLCDGAPATNTTALANKGSPKFTWPAPRGGGEIQEFLDFDLAVVTLTHP